MAAHTDPIRRYKNLITKRTKENEALIAIVAELKQKISDFEAQTNYSLIAKEEMLAERERLLAEIESLKTQLKEALEKQIVRMETEVVLTDEQEKPKSSRRKKSKVEETSEELNPAEEVKAEE